jgi:hypothetical protein
VSNIVELSPKKVGSGTLTTEPFVRDVIRSIRLTAWTTCSGPTATQGSGGSMPVSPVVAALTPANPARTSLGAAVDVAGAGAAGVVASGAWAVLAAVVSGERDV